MKYNEIVNILKYIYSLDNSFKDILAIAGGVAPYLAYNTESNRLHSDIDIVCNLKDMNKVREVLKKNNNYENELDSLTHYDKDYGFETLINGLKVGFYPYEYKKSLFQYSYDSNNGLCKTKKLNFDLSQYIKVYSQYKVMAIEIILKSKINSNRKKDIIDLDFICKNRFDNKFYSEIEIINI